MASLIVLVFLFSFSNNIKGVQLTAREGLRYETEGDACRKFWIRPLKETNLGVAQAFCDY